MKRNTFNAAIGTPDAQEELFGDINALEEKAKQKNTLSWVFGIAAGILVAFLWFSHSASEKLQSNLDDQIVQTATANKSVAEVETLKAEMAKSALAMKEGESKRQELVTQLSLAQKSAEDAMKYQQEAAKALDEAKRQVADRELLSQKAIKADLYETEAKKAEASLAEVEAKLAIADAKILELLEGQSAGSKTTDMSGQSDNLFSRQPVGLHRSIQQNASEPRWKASFRSYLAKAEQDLHDAQAKGIDRSIVIKLQETVNTFRSALAGSMSQSDRDYLERFSQNGELKEEDKEDIRSALGTYSKRSSVSNKTAPPSHSIRPN